MAKEQYQGFRFPSIAEIRNFNHVRLQDYYLPIANRIHRDGKYIQNGTKV